MIYDATRPGDLALFQFLLSEFDLPLLHLSRPEKILLNAVKSNSLDMVSFLLKDEPLVIFGVRSYHNIVQRPKPWHLGHLFDRLAFQAALGGQIEILLTIKSALESYMDHILENFGKGFIPRGLFLGENPRYLSLPKTKPADLVANFSLWALRGAELAEDPKVRANVLDALGLESVHSLRMAADYKKTTAALQFLIRIAFKRQNLKAVESLIKVNSKMLGDLQFQLNSDLLHGSPEHVVQFLRHFKKISASMSFDLTTVVVQILNSNRQDLLTPVLDLCAELIHLASPLDGHVLPHI